MLTKECVQLINLLNRIYHQEQRRCVENQEITELVINLIATNKVQSSRVEISASQAPVTPTFTKSKNHVPSGTSEKNRKIIYMSLSFFFLKNLGI
jgi:hypothetical protein